MSKITTNKTDVCLADLKGYTEELTKLATKNKDKITRTISEIDKMLDENKGSTSAGLKEFNDRINNNIQKDLENLITATKKAVDNIVGLFEKEDGEDAGMIRSGISGGDKK